MRTLDGAICVLDLALRQAGDLLLEPRRRGRACGPRRALAHAHPARPRVNGLTLRGHRCGARAHRLRMRMLESGTAADQKFLARRVSVLYS